MNGKVRQILDKIYGSDAQKSYFAAEAERGGIAHAYIFEGASGSGRYTLAKAVCALISGDERAAGIIEDGEATDVITLDLDDGKRTIGIDAVRALRADAYIKPNDFDFKAYIIRNADKMTVQAQNALLKLLEEPPRNVYFFLLCENGSSLLPTVRSRAPVIRMQILSYDELFAYLVKNSDKARALERTDPEALAHIIRQNGTIGGALSALEHSSDGAGDGFTAVLSIIEALVSGKKGELYLSVSRLPQKRDEFMQIVSDFMTAVRDMIMIKHGRTSAELLFGYTGELSALSKKMTQKQLTEIYTCLEQSYGDLSLNMNVQTVKTVLSSDLTAIAQ